MAESTTLVRIVIALGTVFLMVGLMGATFPEFAGANNGWTTFSNSLTSTPFPSFQNPFDERYEVDLRIVNDANPALYNTPSSATDTYGSVDACTNATNPTANYYGCVSTPDGNASYAGTANVAGHSQFAVNLSAAGGVSSDYPLLGVRLVVQCAAASAIGADTIFLKSDDVTILSEVPTDPFHCAAAYGNVTVYNYFVTPYPKVGDYASGRVVLHPNTSPFAANFSYLRVTLIYGADKDCTGADTLTYIGCVLGGFFNFVVRLGRLIVNGAVFIAQVIFYALSLIATLFYGLFTMVTFFLAIPGAPAPVQAAIAIPVVGIIVWVLYIVLKHVGSLVGGLNPV